MDADTPPQLSEADLAGELLKLAQRGVARAFISLRSAGPLDLKSLWAALAYLYPAEWSTDHASALQRGLSDAIDLLPPTVVPLTTMSWQAFGKAMYSPLNRREISDDGKYYGNILKQILPRQGSGVASRQTRGRNLREAMARNIMQLVAASADGNPDPIIETSDPVDSTLLERPEYIELIRSAVQSSSFVWIWGEPGVGKTVLARHAAQELAPAGVIHIQLGEEGSARRSVIEALIAEGLHPANWSPAYELAQLRQVLSGTPKSTLVLIDNAGSFEQVTDVVSEAPAVPVLITARLPPPSTLGDVVYIGELTVSQAHALVQSRAASISDVELHNLMALLGRRPLALDHALRYLESIPAATVQGLIDALRASVNQTLASLPAGNVSEASLSELYAAISDALDPSGGAGQALDIFLALSGTSGVVLDAMLMGFAKQHYATPLAFLRFQSGLATLEQLGLIRRNQSFWSMHGLTWSILFEIRGAAVAHAETAFISMMIDGTFAIDFSGLNSGDDPDELLIKRIDHSWLWLMQARMNLSANFLSGTRYVHRIDDDSFSTLELPEADGEGSLATRYRRSNDALWKFDRAEATWAECDDGEKIELAGLLVLLDVFWQALFTLLPQMFASDELVASPAKQIEFRRGLVTDAAERIEKLPAANILQLLHLRIRTPLMSRTAEEPIVDQALAAGLSAALIQAAENLAASGYEADAQDIRQNMDRLIGTLLDDSE